MCVSFEITIFVIIITLDSRIVGLSVFLISRSKMFLFVLSFFLTQKMSLQRLPTLSVLGGHCIGTLIIDPLLTVELSNSTKRFFPCDLLESIASTLIVDRMKNSVIASVITTVSFMVMYNRNIHGISNVIEIVPISSFSDFSPDRELLDPLHVPLLPIYV